MLLTYVDESFTEDWYTMAALILDGPAAVNLTKALDQVASEAAKTYSLGPDVELHGVEIFQRGGRWGNVPPRARVAVFDDVIDAVAAQDLHVPVNDRTAGSMGPGLAGDARRARESGP